MDRKIIASKRSTYRLFHEFQCIDLIPYSMAVLLLLGSIYILMAAIQFSRFAK